jgi:hypothetical protein
MRMDKKQPEYDPECSECNPVPGSLSISMRSEFNDVIEDSQISMGGEVIVEIPLDKRVNQVKIKMRGDQSEPFRSKTYNIRNNQLE